VKPTPKTEAETAEEQQQKQTEEADRALTRRLAIGTVLVGILQIIAIGFQVGIAWRQNTIITQQSAIMEGQRTAAVDQATITLAQKRVGDKQLVEMQAQLEVARKSADAARDAASAATANVDALKVIERAYVAVDPIAYRFGPNHERTGHYSIKNYGRTPASVSNILMAEFIQEPGEAFPDPESLEQLATSEDRTSTRLMPGEEHFLRMEHFDTPANLSPENIRAGIPPLWLLGYVDYIDEFGIRYRSGFARKYAPHRSEDKNLVIELRHRYNYDRRRVKGEGNDWDES
jgi:hypothetical protein